MEKVYSWNGWTCKLGDTVKVWRKVESHDPDGMGVGEKWEALWNNEMVDSGGFIICEKNENFGFRSSVDYFNYPLKALVPPEYFDMNQDNKPPKLEPFMRVKTRNGDVYIFCEGNFYQNNEWMQFCDYDENLLMANRKYIDWDIVKVYNGHKYSLALNFDFLGDLIWERKEEDPKLTALKKSLEELEAKASDIKRQIEEFGK